MEDIAAVEDIVQTDIFLYVIDTVDGYMNGELARRKVGKLSNTVRLLGYKSHICNVSIINTVFKAYRCPSCDEVMRKAYDLDRHLIICKGIYKLVFPKNVYQPPETLFDKLDSFNITYSDDQKLFKNMAIFDLESICVEENKFRDTATTSWIGKRVQISVSISSNLIEQRNFLCNSDPAALL